MVIKDIILLRFVNRECDWGNVSLNRWSHIQYTAPLYNSLNTFPRAALYALVSSQSRRGFSFGTRRSTNETTKKRSPAPPTRYGDIRVQSTRAVDCSSTAHRRLMSLTTQGRLNHTLGNKYKGPGTLRSRRYTSNYSEITLVHLLVDIIVENTYLLV